MHDPDASHNALAMRYAAWLVRWRWAVILASVILCLAASAGLARIAFSSDYRDFFRPDDPQLLANEALRDAYADDNQALVAFVPKDGTVFTPRVLDAMARFTEQAWRLPHVRRVDSLTNHQHAEASGDDLRVRPLYRPDAGRTPEAMAAIRTIALSEPLLVKRLVSPDGTVAGVSISFTLPAPTELSLPEAVKGLRALMAETRALTPEVRIMATGGVLLDNAFDEEAKADLATLTPLMYALILVVMFVALRSVFGVAAAMLATTLSIFAALGMAGWLGVKLTAISVSTPTILTTIAVANCLHMIVYTIRRMGAGASRHDAVREAVAANAPIMLVACGTDALGFFSMCLSDVPPIASFGVMLGIGAIVVLALSVSFLPACLAVLPITGQPAMLRQGHAIGRMAGALVAWRRPVFIAVALLNLVAAWFVTRNQLEDNFVDYFSPAVEFRRDTDFIQSHLSGVHTVYYSIPAGATETVASAGYLRDLDRFANWLREQPEVFHVGSLADVVKRVHRTLHDDEPAAYRIPDDDLTAAQSLLVYELSLPPGLDLNDQIRIDRSATKLTVVLHDTTSAALVAFDQRVQDWMHANLPPGMRAAGTGPSVMFSRIGEMNVAGTLKGYVLQIVLISVVIGLVLRSVRLGFASLLPNVLPSLMAFGLWGAFVGHVGLSVAVVGVLTYGIIVDDTIHSVFKYHRARTVLGLSPRAAVENAYSISGMAVLFTTSVLVAGFGVLIFSHFDLNADMGIMSVVTIALAAIVDLVLLPPLLFAIDPGTPKPVSALHPSPLKGS
ncbi:efflux RND transporter permease subunit [Cupriavidus campinensis]